MKLFFVIIIFFYTFQINNLVFANNTNYYDILYSQKDLRNIRKLWTYSSNVFKRLQTKMVQYNDKIIHLDGNKNLIVISLTDGRQICKNEGTPDRGKYRGINIYIKNKSSNQIFAVFPRQGEIKLINIFNCRKKLPKKIKQKKFVSANINFKNQAILLPNEDTPKSYNLDTGQLLWKANIDQKQIKKLKKFNKNKDLAGMFGVGGLLMKNLTK